MNIPIRLRQTMVIVAGVWAGIMAACALEVSALPHGVQKQLKDFGYGSDRAVVFRDEDPAAPLSVGPSDVSWLAVVNGHDRTILLVMLNRGKKPVQTHVKVDLDKLGLTPEAEATDLATRQKVPVRHRTVTVTVSGRSQETRGHYVVEFILEPGNIPRLLLIGQAPRR